ncbi:class I SAM-dependent methyltransferase [bacterium]|nr:class I SAM-dependent methyltransferase [bacterium]
MFSRILVDGMRVMDREKLIRDSGLFDPEWYIERYPEVGQTDRALAHFLKTGATKGNDPGPNFSTQAYLADNPDVAASGMNALLHYLRFGQFEGRIARDHHRRPSGGSAEHGLGEAALARVRAAFDAAFYHDTNPDLPSDADAFAHFMGPGWRQRRDPADWFSTDSYLRHHGDVFSDGQNPFVHYVLGGCREGRGILPSIKSRHRNCEAKAGLRTAVVAMIKNEADIIRVFAAHALALFDEIVIVDHRSDDGTVEFLTELATSYAQVTLLHLDEPSYIQSVTMTHVVHDLQLLQDMDWVFFLDADEFLPFANRDQFHASLGGFGRCPVIAMHWQNLIPESYWDSAVTFDSQTSFLTSPTASPFRKIAFQPGRVPLHRTVVAQGNHSLTETLNGLELPAFEVDFPLYHLPVRSADQLLLKLNQGVLSYQKIGQSRDAGQGTHWYQMKQATADQSLSAEHLNAMAVDYSEDKDRIVPVSRDELQKMGFRVQTFCPAQRDLDLPEIEPREIGEMLIQLYGEDFTDAATDDTPGATRLETWGERLVRASNAPEYPCLPDVAKEDVTPDLSTVLKTLLQPSYQSIDDLMPSDWAGHVPFMFALAGMLRPRRFVEVGTLRGASFFALAQAVKKSEFSCDSVAVSSWAVEPHLEPEFANVFEDFQFVARKYADQTGVLRMAWETALHRFQDGSIDLLHLDGLYDYEGAANMLRLWQPKLAPRGVVLIHDIHAHGGDFGVWRLWDELRANHPSVEFQHDQGLGMVCLGDAPPPALRVLAQAFERSADLRTMLQQHFEAMGRLSTELFSRRYDMAQIEMRAAAEGAQTEELSWVRQELAAVRAEADSLREMVNGGLRHAAKR